MKGALDLVGPHSHGERFPASEHVEVDFRRAGQILGCGFARPPQHGYTVHGEPGPATALVKALRAHLGWQASPAQDLAVVEIP